MNFASNVKFLRKRKNRTQDDVAVALNMKRSTLSGYENGVAEPGIGILEVKCRRLKASGSKTSASLRTSQSVDSGICRRGTR